MAKTEVYVGSNIDDVADPKVRRKLDRLCKEHRELREQINGLEKLTKETGDEIRAIAEHEGIDKIKGDGWLLLKTRTERKTISAEKLLQMGVELSVIEAATEVKVSEGYQVRGVKP
jgi:hypothetical protein